MLFDKLKVSTVALSAFKYTAANLLNAVVPILLLPILTVYLSKEEYGMLSIFQVIVMIVLPFMGFNAQSAIEREYFNTRTIFPVYVSNAVLLLGISGVTIAVIFLAFNSAISNLIDFPASILWTIPVYCIFHNLCEILLSTWRVRDKATSYGLFRVGRTILEIGVSLLLVVVAKKGMIGRIEGMLVAVISFGTLALWVLHQANAISARLNRRYLKDIMKFGLPLIPHTIGGIALVYADRVFISKMLGMAETGSYTVGYQIAMGVYLLQSSFNLAWVPWFYNQLGLNSDTANLKIVKITYWYFLALMCLVGILTAICPFVFHIFIDEKYNDSIQFVFWIALAFGLDGMYKMVVNYIFYLKKTYVISVITVSTAVLNLGLNYYFITWNGALGAAKATALCMLVQFVIVWMISHKLYPMPWFVSRKI